MDPTEQRPMTEQEYRAYPAVNYSTLKHMRKSPLHYRAHLEAGPDPALSQKLAMFSAVHTLVLEPFQFTDEYAVYEGRRDKRTKAYQAFLAENEGKRILSLDELEQANAIAGAVMEHDWVVDLLADEGTATEQPIVWEDADAGTCKGKPDIMHFSHARGLIVADLKSFASTDGGFIARQGAKNGWPLQLVHYLHAAAAHYNLDLSAVPFRVVNIVVEASSPHDVTVAEWGAATIDAAFAQHRSLLMRLGEHQGTGQWPGRESFITIEAPDYLL